MTMIQPFYLENHFISIIYCEFHHIKSPCLIDDTGFKLIGFLTIFKYLLACSGEEDSVIKCFPSFPDGIPLLTADSQLHIFSDPPRVLCSKYSHNVSEKCLYVFKSDGLFIATTPVNFLLCFKVIL